MASPTQWTWVWVNCENWWWTGKTSVLQSMGLQRVRHDQATEQYRKPRGGPPLWEGRGRERRPCMTRWTVEPARLPGIHSAPCGATTSSASWGVPDHPEVCCCPGCWGCSPCRPGGPTMTAGDSPPCWGPQWTCGTSQTHWACTLPWTGPPLNHPVHCWPARPPTGSLVPPAAPAAWDQGSQWAPTVGTACGTQSWPRWPGHPPAPARTSWPAVCSATCFAWTNTRLALKKIYKQ